jgi:hypothetical protein
MRLLRDLATWAASVLRAWYGWVGASATVGIVGFGQGMGWWGTPPKSVYVWLLVTGIMISMFQAWRKEHVKVEDATNEKAALESKYFDQRPQLSFEAHSVEGPNAWFEHPNPVVFTIHNLSGRPPTSIYFEPIRSINGKYSLQFDSLPHIDSKGFEGVGFEVNEIGATPLSAADRETTSRYKKIMLRDNFLDDSPNEFIELEYELICHFRDGEEERSRSFRLVFDKARWRFLTGITQPKPQ